MLYGGQRFDFEDNLDLIFSLAKKSVNELLDKRSSTWPLPVATTYSSICDWSEKKSNAANIGEEWVTCCLFGCSFINSPNADGISQGDDGEKFFKISFGQYIPKGIQRKNAKEHPQDDADCFRP